MQDESTTPYGYCHCGCGKRTTVSRYTDRAAGYYRGEPRLWVIGHNVYKRVRYEQQDRGYKTPCWVWLLAKNANGYGTTKLGLAHRVEYATSKGSIPDGMELDHLCKVRACVNPDHLEPVTRMENNRRTAGGRTAPDKCSACGKFLRKDSDYANRCSECRGPEDELV